MLRTDGEHPDGMTLVHWSMGRTVVCDVTGVEKCFGEVLRHIS